MKMSICERVINYMEHRKRSYRVISNFDALIFYGEKLLRHNEGKYILISVDIKELQVIDETLGFMYGNEIVEEVVKKIQYLFGKKAKIFRGCANQFVIFMESSDRTYSKQCVETLCRHLQEIRMRDGRKIGIDIEIGIYEIPKEEDNMLNCLNKADFARILSRDEKSGSYAFYDKEYIEKIYERKNLEQQLKEGIENQEFEVYLQPKINVKTKKVVGAEALVRWKEGNHPKVGPDLFIPILEKNGLIKQLDFYVIEEVC